MMRTPKRQTERMHDAVLDRIGAWSTREVKAEVNQASRDLEKARALELAARIRNAEEKTPEAETALQYRRDEVARIYRRYARFLDDLEARSETYTC